MASNPSLAYLVTEYLHFRDISCPSVFRIFLVVYGKILYFFPLCSSLQISHLSSPTNNSQTIKNLLYGHKRFGHLKIGKDKIENN
jgi:hypothetical protein